MPKRLTTDETLEAPARIDHPMTQDVARRREGVANEMAAAIGGATATEAGRACWQGLALCGMGVGFASIRPGDPMPTAFEGLDEEGDWVPRRARR